MKKINFNFTELVELLRKYAKVVFHIVFLIVGLVGYTGVMEWMGKGSSSGGPSTLPTHIIPGSVVAMKI